VSTAHSGVADEIAAWERGEAEQTEQQAVERLAAAGALLRPRPSTDDRPIPSGSTTQREGNKIR